MSFPEPAPNPHISPGTPPARRRRTHQRFAAPLRSGNRPPGRGTASSWPAVASAGATVQPRRFAGARARAIADRGGSIPFRPCPRRRLHRRIFSARGFRPRNEHHRRRRGRVARRPGNQDRPVPPAKTVVISRPTGRATLGGWPATLLRSWVAVLAVLGLFAFSFFLVAVWARARNFSGRCSRPRISRCVGSTCG